MRSDIRNESIAEGQMTVMPEEPPVDDEILQEEPRERPLQAIDRIVSETEDGSARNGSFSQDQVSWLKGCFKMLTVIAKSMEGRPEPTNLITLERPSMSKEELEAAMDALMEKEDGEEEEPKENLPQLTVFRWVAENSQGSSQVMALVALANKLGFEYSAYEQQGELHNTLYLRPKLT